MNEYTEQKIHELTTAAKQGNAEAQYDLGHYYHNEYYSQKDHDDAKAAEWFKKAAKQGHADAQFWLGLLYHNGEGVPQSQIRAIDWCTQAAHQGQLGAKEFLEAMQSGRIVIKNKDSRCFIASAIYGPLAIETNILREWRDNKLLLSFPGRIFTSFYYFVSPLLSSVIVRHKTLKKITRNLLDIFIAWISR